MVILNEPSSPAKKNLDHAFPPFALGLPSVFERAGFDVNKKAKSRSSSRSGSRATSLNGSRAASINGSQSTIFGSSPKLGQAQHQSLGDGRSMHNKSGLSLALPKLRKAMSDLTVKGSSTNPDASLADSNPTIIVKSQHEYSANTHRESTPEHFSKFHPDHTPEQHQDHSMRQQHEFQDEYQYEHQPEYGQERNSGGHLTNLSAAPSATEFGHSLYPEQLSSKPGSLHHTDNSDDFDMRSAKSNFNVQDEIAAGHKKQGLPLAQFSGDSEDEEDSELPEPLRAPLKPTERDNGSPMPSVPPHGYHAEAHADGISPQESFHDAQLVSSSPSSIPVNPLSDTAERSNVLPYPLDDEEEFAAPAEHHENSHQTYHPESETLPREAAYSSKPSANGSDIFNSASLTSAEREHDLTPMPHSSDIPPKFTPQNQEGSPQAAQPQGVSPQSLSPRFMSPHSMSPHSMSPHPISANDFTPQGTAPQPNLLHGMPPHAMIPQGTIPRGMVPPALSAQGMGPRGMPPQGGPMPVGYPGPRPSQHPGMSPQGMYPQSQGGRPGHGGVSPQQLNQDLYMNAQRRFPRQSGSPIINQTGFGSQNPAMNPNASVGPLPPHMNGIIRPVGPMNQHVMSSQMNRPPMGPNGLPMGFAQGQLMGRPPMPHPMGPPMRQHMGGTNGMPMGPMIPRGQGERPHGPNVQPPMNRATPSLGHHGGPPLIADPITPTLSSGQFAEASANGDYYASNESSISSQVGDTSNNHTAETSPMDTQKRAVLQTSPLHFNNSDLLGVQNRQTKHLSGSSSIYSSMPVEDPNVRGSVACIPANSGMPSNALPGDISTGHSSEPSQNSSVSFDFNQSLLNTAPAREEILLSDTETDRSYPSINRGAALNDAYPEEALTPTLPNDTYLEEVPTPTLPLTQFRSESPASSSMKGSKTRKQCRGCLLPISGKSIRASDKTLSGRWHRECFNCTRCSDSLAGVGKIHVLNDQPFCGRCYHIVNNSTCRSCNQGIEGSCLETRLSSDGGQPLLYHAHCLRCAQCQTTLQQTYFDVGGSTYCAEHAFSSLSDVNSVHKRYTQFMMI